MDHGYPLITESVPLEKLLQKENIMEKVENKIIAPLMNEKENSDALEKYIESMSDVRQEKWNSGHSTSNEEILFDLIEYIDCLIDKY